jgi:hypothetical protein
MYDLEKFAESTIWASVVQHLYESFPKSVVFGQNESGKGENKLRHRIEQFYCPSFYKGQIYKEILTDEQIELYISMPMQSYANLTRIYINKAIWIGTTKMLGYKPKVAPYLFKYLHDVYTDGAKKQVTVMKIIDALAKKGNNPVVSFDDENVIEHFIGLILMLKIFEQVLQNLSVEDWFYEADVRMMLKNTNEQDLDRLLDTVYKYWNEPQVKIPTADLPTLAEFKILPIFGAGGRDDRNKRINATGDQVTFGKRAVQDGASGSINDESPDQQRNPNLIEDALSQANFVADQPILYITEILVDAERAEGSGILTNGEFRAKFAKIITLNAVDREEAVTYSKGTGRFSGITSSTDANWIVNVVFPLEMYISEPDHHGIKLPQNQWRLIYVTQRPYNPIFVVEKSIERFLFGQKSFAGPNYYLVDSEDWIGPGEWIDKQVAVPKLTKKGTPYKDGSMDVERKRVYVDMFSGMLGGS